MGRLGIRIGAAGSCTTGATRLIEERICRWVQEQVARSGNLSKPLRGLFYILWISVRVPLDCKLLEGRSNDLFVWHARWSGLNPKDTARLRYERRHDATSDATATAFLLTWLWVKQPHKSCYVFAVRAAVC